MKRIRITLLAGLAVLLLAALAIQLQPAGPSATRGKSPARPVQQELTQEEQLAQDLALSDARVQDLTVGHRSEVFWVRAAGAHVPASSRVCLRADCRQVEIYNYDENATVTAIVNLDARRVLDVLYLPDARPLINQSHFDRAVDLILEAGQVQDELGYLPDREDVLPMMSNLQGNSCDGSHLCMAAAFHLGDRVLWAHADLTEDRFAGIAWTPALPDTGTTEPFAGQGCATPGSVDQDGWQLSYETTGTDGLRLYDITYAGRQVLTSAKIAQWHVDYGQTGFQDQTGCGGAGYVIAPYGDPQILELTEDGNPVGFEIMQDFRLANWGQTCNYRYEFHMQFYQDGRFRVVGGAFGKGCGSNALYRPLIRLDMAVDGDGGDNFGYWDGAQWVMLTEEDYRIPDASDPDKGPHRTDTNGYAWRVADAGGNGYYIEMDVGQFPDGGRGAEPFLYATRHNPAEGDADIGPFGSCCNDDYRQGPHQFLNSEPIENENIVIWYVSQSETDVNPGQEYCWTISGEPNPETYPCFAGPMFHPSSPQDPTLTGSVNLQGRSDQSGASIEVWQGAVLVQSTTSAADGSFALLVADGTYDVVLDHPSYLAEVQSGVPISGGAPVSLGTVELRGGDINDDRTIDMLDINAIGAAFGLGCADPGYQPIHDLNADCTIDILDLAMAGGNFGSSTE